MSVFSEVSRIVVEFANDHLFERLPWALLSIGIFLGGCVVLFIFKRIMRCICLSPKYRNRYVRAGVHKNLDGTTNVTWKLETHHPMGSFWHLFIEVFFIIALVITIWIAAHVAGFNFWTSSLMGVGLGLVGTYMVSVFFPTRAKARSAVASIYSPFFFFYFGQALHALGSGIFVYIPNK